MASGNPTPTPTGCFKCGRPGHWSRDCPSARSSSDVNLSASGGSSKDVGAWKTPQKPPKSSDKPSLSLPRKRPKLTPELLLSNDGLGYVLERFPRMVKIQGHGHEVEDLQSLLDAYVHWHSRLLPYYSFNQFVEKVEKVGSTKRVRVCVRELKDKALRGEQPEPANDDKTQGGTATEMDLSPIDGPELENHEGPSHDALPDDIHEDLFDAFYKQAVEEAPPAPSHSISPTALSQPAVPSADLGPNETVPDDNNMPPTCISEDQKLRMETNRLKALERAKARAAVDLSE